MTCPRGSLQEIQISRREQREKDFRGGSGWEERLGRSTEHDRTLSDGEMNKRKIPKTLDEAYELRDCSTEPEERHFYQKCVYGLRASQYSSRGIVTESSIVQRQKRRAEARLRPQSIEVEDERRGWWKKVSGLARTRGRRLRRFGQQNTAGRSASEQEE